MNILPGINEFLKRPLVGPCLMMLAGIITACSTLKPKLVFISVVLFLAAILVLIIRYDRKPPERLTNYIIIWLMMPVMFATGMLRATEALTKSPLAKELEKPCEAEVSGTIENISIHGEKLVLTLEPSSVILTDHSLISNRILVYVEPDGLWDTDSNNWPEEAAGLFDVGEIIKCTGKMYAFEEARNPGMFDSRTYYAARNTDARLNAESIYCQGSSDKILFKVKSILYVCRKKIMTGIYRVFPSREAGTVNAMLTGDRGMLEEEVKNAYSNGGIAHILSISALHVSLLGLGLFRLLRKISGRIRLSAVLATVIIWAYGILTGLSVSTLRAVMMLTVTLAGRLIGKRRETLNSIALAVILVMFANPLFIFDAGFKMSFTAVLGIYAAGRITRRLEIKNNVLKSLVSSLCVFMFTLPAVMQTYYYVNPISILVNLTVIPFMSIVLTGSIISGISGALGAVNAGKLAAGPVYYILKYFDLLCRIEEKLGISNFITGAASNQQIIIYCILLIISVKQICRLKKQDSKKKDISKKNTGKLKKAFVPVITAAIGILVLIIRPDAGKTTISVLDVGQGDSIFVKEGDVNVLIDCGSTNIGNVGKYRLIPFLKYKGVKKLDKIIISHTDSDHVSGIREMLESGYPQIGEIIFGCKIEASDETAELAHSKGVSVRSIAAGDSIELNGMTLRCISPSKEAYYDDDNDASVVLELESDTITGLLTGDSGFNAEQMYAGMLGRTSYDFLKVPHHGSKYSCSEEMLKAVRPAISLISCSKYNTYGHPNPVTLARLLECGSEIFTTPEYGMITVERDEKGRITVKCFCPDYEATLFN